MNIYSLCTSDYIICMWVTSIYISIIIALTVHAFTNWNWDASWHWKPLSKSTGHVVGMDNYPYFFGRGGKLNPSNSVSFHFIISPFHIILFYFIVVFQHGFQHHLNRYFSNGNIYHAHNIYIYVSNIRSASIIYNMRVSNL